MELLKLFNELQKVWIKADEAKKLVDDGKEVLCSNKLQGVLTNLTQVIELLGAEIKSVQIKEQGNGLPIL